jgi:hypothetical protein
MRVHGDPTSPARLLEVLTTLRTHGEREDEVLAAYRRLVEGSSDEGVRYLGRLMIEDEERHHRLIDEMASRIESWLVEVEIDAETPALSPRVDRELIDGTGRLLALERQDAKELRLLRRELRDTPATSLLRFSADLMLRDTAKHIEILRFIRTHTG